MDRLEAMGIFLAVAETGSLTAAARRLGMPLTSISRKLAELEGHLGTRLIARSTRRLALTDEGSAYHPRCKRILADVEEAERDAADRQASLRGEIVLSAPIVFGRLHVLPAVTGFLDLHPSVQIRMLLSDRNAHLLEDEIDVAVRIGSLRDSSMIASRVGAVRRVVCASPAFLERHGSPRTPADLATMPCIGFDLAGASAPWRFPGPRGRDVEITVPQRLTVTGAEAALDAAVAGLGLTRILSYQAASAVADGLLRVVLQAYEPEPIPVHLLHQGREPLRLRRFLDFAAPVLSDRLSGLARMP